MKKVKCVLVVYFILILLVGSLQAQQTTVMDLPKTELEYGFSAGYLFGGDINISDAPNDFRKNGSLLIKGFLDAYLIPKLAVGLYVQYTSTKLEEIDEYLDYTPTGDPIQKERIIKGHTGSAFEIGGSIKPRFFINQNLAIKPGVYIGYRKMYFDFTAECGLKLDDAQGMAVNGGVEVQYKINPQYLVFLDFGLVTQPYGGKEDITHLDFGPIMYISAGVAL